MKPAKIEPATFQLISKLVMKVTYIIVDVGVLFGGITESDFVICTLFWGSFLCMFCRWILILFGVFSLCYFCCSNFVCSYVLTCQENFVICQPSEIKKKNSEICICPGLCENHSHFEKRDIDQ